jgi:hypothetical protein
MGGFLLHHGKELLIIFEVSSVNYLLEMMTIILSFKAFHIFVAFIVSMEV